MSGFRSRILAAVAFFLLVSAGAYLLATKSGGLQTPSTKLITITGREMEPNLSDGQQVQLQTDYILASLKRGTIVALNLQGRSEPVIARIAAVAGDSVSFRGNRIRLNGTELAQLNFEGSAKFMLEMPSQRIDNTDTKPKDSLYEVKRELAGSIGYLILQRKENIALNLEGSFKIPPRHIWVLCDNRDNCSDGRAFGPVEINSIAGVVLTKADNSQNISGTATRKTESLIEVRIAIENANGGRHTFKQLNPGDPEFQVILRELDLKPGETKPLPQSMAYLADLEGPHGNCQDACVQFVKCEMVDMPSCMKSCENLGVEKTEKGQATLLAQALGTCEKLKADMNSKWSCLAEAVWSGSEGKRATKILGEGPERVAAEAAALANCQGASSREQSAKILTPCHVISCSHK